MYYIITEYVLLQNSFGSSSFAELLSAPYPEESSAALPEDLDPFQDVVFHGSPEPAPLPSFQETYASSLGFKMEDECYTVAGQYQPAPQPTPPQGES